MAYSYHEGSSHYDSESLNNSFDHENMDTNIDLSGFTEVQNRNRKRTNQRSPHISPSPKKVLNQSSKTPSHTKPTFNNSQANNRAQQHSELHSNHSQLPVLQEYTSDILLPYKIIVKITDNENSSSDQHISPIKIARNLTPLFPNCSLVEFKKSGRNNIIIITYRRNLANAVLKHNYFKDSNLLPFIPSSYHRVGARTSYLRSARKNVPSQFGA